MKTAQLEGNDMNAALLAVRGLASTDWSTQDDDSILEAFQAGQVLESVLRAAQGSLIREIDRRRITTDRHGLDTAEWWQAQGGVGGRTARITVRQARELAAFPLVAEALGAGTITGEQSAAMVSGLVLLPSDAPEEAVTSAQQYLLGRAGDLDLASLRKAARKVAEVVLPESAEETAAEAAEEQQRRARRDRYFSYGRDEADGVMWFRGRLPIGEGEQLMEAINTVARRAWRSEAATRLAERSGQATGLEEYSSMNQLRADALVDLAGRGDNSPKSVRFTVLVPLEHLTSANGTGILAETGEVVSPSQLRRLACDASILPVVMGGPSEVLDLGREQRLVSSELRQALVVRDRGCVFPGCDRPPADCEAHHVVPWAQGGVTSHDNLVLLCPHHHRMVEPHPRSLPGVRWQLRVAEDGLAEVLPPRRVDEQRHPRRHKRFNLDGPPGAGPDPMRVT